MAIRKVQLLSKATPDAFSNEAEMKHAIIEAYFEIQDISEKNKQLEKQKLQEKIFGLEKPQPTSKILCKLLKVWSDIKAFCKLLFIKQEDVLEGLGTVSLLKLILLLVFFLLRCGLYVFAICEVYSTFVNKSIWGIAIAIFAFIFARILRIVSLEIDNMKDKEYLISVFSCVMSFGAIVIAIIAILKK